MVESPLYARGRTARQLRALGHHLKPLALIGRQGVSASLTASVDQLLTAHQLVKVRLQDGCPLDRRQAAELLAHKTNSAIAQLIGKTFLLFRENPDLPAILEKKR